MRMEHRKLSRWLLLAGGIAALGGLTVLLVYAPALGRECCAVYPELAHLFWPGLCYVWAVGALLGCALWQYMKICIRIGQGRSFCRENGEGLDWISRFLFISAACCAAAPILLQIAAGQSGPVWIACLLFAMAGAAMGILARVMGKLLMRAVELQEENDLTI